MAYVTASELNNVKKIFKASPVQKTGIDIPPANAARLADAQASKVISKAHLDAQQIVNQADEQAAEITEKARKIGFTKGQAEARQKYDNLIGIMQKVLDNMDEMHREMSENLRETIISLGLEIAGKVLKHEIKMDPSALKDLVTDVLSRTAPAKNVVVNLNPLDFEVLKELKSVFENAAGYPDKFKISPNSSLGRGDVVVNYHQGTIDARASTQLKNITDSLMEKVDQRTQS
ncbi:MAG: FliH/SctL family protein [bacterium]